MMPLEIPVKVRVRRYKPVLWLIKATLRLQKLLGDERTERAVNAFLGLIKAEMRIGRKWRRLALDLKANLKSEA